MDYLVILRLILRTKPQLQLRLRVASVVSTIDSLFILKHMFYFVANAAVTYFYVLHFDSNLFE